MASSNVLFVALLGLFVSTLANPPTEAPSNITTVAPTTVGLGGGSGTSPAAGIQDCLTEADKAMICEVKPATGAAPGLCATAGAADDFCSKLAASVNGTSACCAAANVCSFKVGNATGGATGSTTTVATADASITSSETTTTTTTTSAAADTASTTPGTGSTTAGTGSTTAGTGSTAPGTGSTTAGAAIVAEPNTAYVSCDTVPAEFQQIKTCPSSKIIFVYPAVTRAANSTTTFTIPKY